MPRYYKYYYISRYNTGNRYYYIVGNFNRRYNIYSPAKPAPTIMASKSACGLASGAGMEGLRVV